MSEIQRLEELQYDCHSEYNAVMQAEAHDPYLFADYCEEHDQDFLTTHGCTGCVAQYGNRAPDIVFSFPVEDGDDDPMF